MKYDVIIIGSGPAGYVAGIRAGQVGLRTVIIEKESIGGMCLNWGCIPSKAVIESAKLYNKVLKDAAKFGVDGIDKKKITFNYGKAVKRGGQIVSKLTKGIEFLLKKNGVEVIKGEASITGEKSVTVNNRNLETDNIIISTGTYIRAIESKVKGPVVEIKDLWKKEDIPSNIIVYGHNSTSLELAQFFALTDKNVTLAVPGNKVMPAADEYLAEYILGILKKDKVKIVFDADLSSMESDLIVNAQNRLGVVPESSVPLDMEDGFIRTYDNCKTANGNIYAIGDVNGKSRFAHIASAQGLHVINHIQGVTSELDIKKYPMNMYTFPEIAQIGSTEAELRDEGIDFKVSEFPLSANAKAMTEGTTEGFIRILSEVKYGEVLGVQIAASNATDLIAEASAFMQIESTVYDVANTVHAHPTVSEVFMEAGFEAIDQAIHK